MGQLRRCTGETARFPTSITLHVTTAGWCLRCLFLAVIMSVRMNVEQNLSVNARLSISCSQVCPAIRPQSDLNKPVCTTSHRSSSEGRSVYRCFRQLWHLASLEKILYQDLCQLFWPSSHVEIYYQSTSDEVRTVDTAGKLALLDVFNQNSC